jgi:putative colanic acid biosynthesis acetyltransferase WcaF
MRLDLFVSDPTVTAEPLSRRMAWYLVNALLFDSWWCPWYGLKTWTLRRFGARVGSGVIIKPRVNVKYPWKLRLGDNVWVGEGVWIDNLGPVCIGSNSCLSQGSYLCTGNHDWSDERFALVVAPIEVEDQVWIGAHSVVAPGARIAQGTVVTAGSVIRGATTPWTVYAGNPAKPVGERTIRSAVPPMVG